MKKLVRGLLTSSFLWASCQGNLDINSSEQEILGGRIAASGEFPTVVALALPFGGGNFFAFCTGTLISPTVVATAAHCIDPAELSDFGLNNDAQVASNIRILKDTINTLVSVPANNVVRVSKTVHSNQFNVNQLQNGNDIGLVFLATPITDRDPSPIELDPGRNFIGTSVTQVGYGVDRLVNNAADQNSGGKEIVLQNKPIASCTNVAGSFVGEDSRLICYDQELTGNNQNSGKCNGDSGGPSFDANGTLIGVTSFGDANCIFFGADTRLSFVANFINTTIQANADLACTTPDGFIFDACGDADGDLLEDVGRGCGKASIAQDGPAKSSTFALFGLFLGTLLLRRRSRK